jgi:hypothetical protein
MKIDWKSGLKIGLLRLLKPGLCSLCIAGLIVHSIFRYIFTAERLEHDIDVANGMKFVVEISLDHRRPIGKFITMYPVEGI